MMRNDAFISHASEDKDDLVRPLTLAMQRRGLKVWYDEDALIPGDSLRKSIDQGLSKADVGIVVFSNAFMAKGWPEYELDGLVARHIHSGSKIIPIWYGVSVEKMLEYSPSLSNLLAIDTSRYSVDEIAEQLVAIIKPKQYSSGLLNLLKRCISKPDETVDHKLCFDYWPGGGIVSAYNRYLTFGSFKTLEGFFGASIYLNDIHRDGLDLRNDHEFGRYNPEFVAWLDRHVAMLCLNSNFTKATHGLFKSFILERLITFDAVRRITSLFPAHCEPLFEKYSKLLDLKELPPGFHMGLFTGNSVEPELEVHFRRIQILFNRLQLEPNVANSALFFWFRRRIDGTHDAFSSISRRLILTYGQSTDFYVNKTLLQLVDEKT